MAEQVGKITGKEGLTFSGPAKVFDEEEDVMSAVANGEIEKGMVIVIRYEGPKGGPGMKEMLNPTSAVMGAGLGAVSERAFPVDTPSILAVYP